MQVQSLKAATAEQAQMLVQTTTTMVAGELPPSPRWESKGNGEVLKRSQSLATASPARSEAARALLALTRIQTVPHCWGGDAGGLKTGAVVDDKTGKGAPTEELVKVGPSTVSSSLESSKCPFCLVRLVRSAVW